MAYDNFLIDKRVVERNIKKGLVDAQSLAQQIESLPDREANCVHVSLEGGAQPAQPSLDEGADESADELGPDEDDDEDDDEADGEEDDTE